MELMLFDKIRQKKVRVGELTSNKFSKVVMQFDYNADEHTYSLWRDILEELKKRNIEYVMLWLQEKDKALYSRVADWEEFGKERLESGKLYTSLSIGYMSPTIERLI